MDILGGRGRLLPVLLVMPAFPPIIFSCEDGWYPLLVPSGLQLSFGMHEHGVLARWEILRPGLLAILWPLDESCSYPMASLLL